MFSAGELSEEVTHKSALCIIPNKSVWASIQPIREKYDEQVKRWMPHINIVYPFCPECEFDEVESILEISNIEDDFFKSLIKKEIKVDSIDYFTQKDKIVVWMKPKDDPMWQKLYDRLQELFPKHLKKKKFVPHLTIAQYRGDMDKFNNFMSIIKGNFKPFTFTIDNFSLISREDDTPFTVIKEIIF